MPLHKLLKSFFCYILKFVKISPKCWLPLGRSSCWKYVIKLSFFYCLNYCLMFPCCGLHIWWRLRLKDHPVISFKSSIVNEPKSLLKKFKSLSKVYSLSTQELQEVSSTVMKKARLLVITVKLKIIFNNYFLNVCYIFFHFYFIY